MTTCEFMPGEWKEIYGRNSLFSKKKLSWKKTGNITPGGRFSGTGVKRNVTNWPEGWIWNYEQMEKIYFVYGGVCLFSFYHSGCLWRRKHGQPNSAGWGRSRDVGRYGGRIGCYPGRPGNYQRASSHLRLVSGSPRDR